MVVAIGLLVFGLARRISYGVLQRGMSKPAQDREVDIRDFLQEMILFGLGTYFAVAAIVTFIYAATRTILDIWTAPQSVSTFDTANLVSSMSQFVIAVLIILGRRPIIRFVGSFRKKENGKSR